MAAPPDIREIQTAVASVLLVSPILKHVTGIFGLTSASKGAMRKKFQQESGIRGSLVLHIGGIAELFRSSRSEERLYLMKRKGFIKVALREKGVDIIPVYLFGNTSVLTVVSVLWWYGIYNKNVSFVCPFLTNCKWWNAMNHGNSWKIRHWRTFLEKSKCRSHTSGGNGSYPFHGMMRYVTRDTFYPFLNLYNMNRHFTSFFFL